MGKRSLHRKTDTPVKNAEAIIDYVVSTTKPLWEQWIDLSYADLDEIFMQSAYEQGGFAATAFYMLLKLVFLVFSTPYILFIWSVQDSN